MAQQNVIAEIPIGDEGVMLVIADWEPDPKILEAEIIKMANTFDNWSVPMEEAKQAMINATRGYFNDEIDPYGNAWSELNEAYLRSKLAHDYSEKILVREGKLQAYATSEEAWFIRDKSIFFNVAGLPKSKKGFPYGAAHQSGTISGERAVLFAKIKTGEGLTYEEASQVITQTGSGHNLPQRMFVGASDEAIAEIEAIFIKHIEETVEGPWHGGGGIIGGPTGAITTTGLTGILTEIPSFGGGLSVRGAGGRFIGRTSG